MSRFLREKFRNFESYTPGEQPRDQQYIKLNTNESPYPPAPSVIEALEDADIEKLRLYPDPTGKRLKEKLADHYGVKPENVFLSNGSDDILNFAFMAFNDEGDELAMPDITYSFYEVVAELHGIRCRKIPLKDDMTVDPEDYCGIGCNLVLPNPNAPTGIGIPVSDIERIAASNPNNVVLIDEAYVDFGTESAVPLTKKYDNLIVSQTFSKSRSFAGGRLGFAIADAGLIEDLTKIQYSTNPYNVNELTLILAEAALDTDDYYKSNSEKIQATRERTSEKLKELGFTVLPSTANFIFIKYPDKSGEYIYKELKKRGILVRHFDNERIRDYNRVTIGTPEQMDTLVEKLKEIL